MRKIINIFALVMIHGLSVNAGELGAKDVCSHPALGQALLAWYGFDGNFNDANGALNANNK